MTGPHRRALPPAAAAAHDEDVVELTTAFDEQEAPPTYHTNALNLFTDQQRPLHTDLPPTLSDAFAVYDAYPQEQMTPPLEIEAPEVVGGWMKDAMGRDYYPAQGVIEEVDDDYVLSTVNNDAYTRPRSLPESATPPPAPVPRVMELFSSFVAESMDTGSQQQYPAPQSPPQQYRGSSSPQPTLLSLPSTPDQNSAMFMYGALLHQDLDTLRNTQHELQVMSLCLAESHPEMHQQLETCYRLESFVIRLLTDLDRMSAITEKQWHSTDVRVQSKLSGRLTSLHRTLARLQAVVKQPLKYTRLRDMFTKLEEHVEKMSHLSTGLREVLTHVLLRSTYVSFRDTHGASSQKHTYHHHHTHHHHRTHTHGHKHPPHAHHHRQHPPSVQRHRDKLRFARRPPATADWRPATGTP